jgi:hypothetical protein
MEVMKSIRTKWNLNDCKKYAEDKDGLCLSDVYVNKETKMIWKCSCGYIWEAVWHHIRHNHWCPKCATNNRKATNIERYGSENPFGSSIVKKRIKDTCISKYGCASATQNTDVQRKMKQTMLDRYGVEHPNQNKEIALRAARKTNKPSIKFHWKTNDELVCQGSWEAKVVDYLNKNQINYLWQPKAFTLSTGKTYRPDLYLEDEDKWVEIKGYFRDDAKAKWDEFISLCPNSELWNVDKLKELNII